MGRLERLFRAVVSAALAYEAVALQVDGLPTITAHVEKRPLLGAVVLGWLHHHFR